MPQIADGFELVGGTEYFGGYFYSATAYILAPVDLGALAEDLHAFFSCVPGTLASASAPASGLCAARILAEGADALYKALNGVRTFARAALELPAPAREVR